MLPSVLEMIYSVRFQILKCFTALTDGQTPLCMRAQGKDKHFPEVVSSATILVQLQFS